MNIKKCAIASIAAMAMLCSGITGICYAEDSSAKTTSASEAAVSSENTGKSDKLSGITAVSSEFDYCHAEFISDEGKVYFSGYKRNGGIYVFTVNDKGRVENKVKISDNKDDAVAEVKQIGDKICVLYNEYANSGIDIDAMGEGWHGTYIPPGGGMQDLYMILLENDLTQIAKYDVTSYSSVKPSNLVGVNSDKICYAKNHKKLYIADHDGNNKQLLLDIDKTDYLGLTIENIAMTEDYIGLEMRNIYNNSTEAYCGIIDLNTNRLITERHDTAIQPEAFGDTILWRSSSGYLPRESEPKTMADLLAETPLITSKTEGYISGIEFVTFKDREFSVTKTEKPIEAVIYGFVDNEDRLITTSYDSEMNQIFNIYENGKCVQTVTADPSKYIPGGAKENGASMTYANGGVIALWYGYIKDGKSYNNALLVPYGTK